MTAPNLIFILNQIEFQAFPLEKTGKVISLYSGNGKGRELLPEIGVSFQIPYKFFLFYLMLYKFNSFPKPNELWQICDI
jgi:hypothetical protein